MHTKINTGYIQQFILSVLAAVIVLSVYHSFFAKDTIVINTLSSDQYVKPVDLLLDKALEPYFHASTPDHFITAAQKTRPCVVFINAVPSKSSDQELADRSEGSGVLISPDGYIVTNHHVIDHGQVIRVTLNDQRTFNARLIGSDPNTDLALIKIEAEQLPYLIFGNSDSLQVGEWVLAVGNPFRLQTTVTAGIVSAKSRDINVLDVDYGIESFIQTDAAINPGNSGGALVNTRGDLVGISTAIITYSGRYEGYGFAIPSNLARKVIRDLQEFGTVHRGLLGIEGVNIRSEMLDELKLDEVSGVLVTTVTSRGGAAEAGIRSGDVILEANHARCHNMSELLEMVGRFRPGDTIVVTYSRAGTIYTTDVLLRNQLNTTDLVQVRSDPILINLGFEVRDLISSEIDRTRVKGIKVISIYQGSTIADTKMEPGYVITRINEKRVESVDLFIRYLKEAEGKIFLEGYYEMYGGPWWYAFEK